MDRLQAMEAFLHVVQTGSFTRAADRLRLPKATVTTWIQNLEARLRVKLLNRTTRKVSVTADGAAYYERCLRILNEVEETESVLTRTATSPQGRLRIDVPVSFGRYILIPALPDFCARYPDIQLEIGCTDRPVDLIEEGVDCVVRGGELSDVSLVARRIATLHFVTCAHRDYIMRHGTPRHPNDLVDHRCIGYFSGKTGKPCNWDFARDGERIEFDVQPYVSVNDSDAYLSAGLAGLGIMQVSMIKVRHALDKGLLVEVLPEWKVDPLPVYVMYPPNRHLSAKVRVFVDWVAALVEGRDEMPLLDEQLCLLRQPQNLAA